MRADSWFYVAANDIFPEEFMRFLAIEPRLREAFLDAHHDLLTASYWREIKQLHLANQAPEVEPYYRLSAGPAATAGNAPTTTALLSG